MGRRGHSLFLLSFFFLFSSDQEKPRKIRVRFQLLQLVPFFFDNIFSYYAWINLSCSVPHNTKHITFQHKSVTTNSNYTNSISTIIIIEITVEEGKGKESNPSQESMPKVDEIRKEKRNWNGKTVSYIWVS